MVVELTRPSNRTLLREGDYHQNLFGSEVAIPDSETFSAYTEGMGQESPYALRWMRSKIRDGTINDVLALLIVRGYAPDAQSAMQKLAVDIKFIQINPVTRLCDLTGERRMPRWLKVVEEMRGRQKRSRGNGDLRRHGTLGHSFLSPLLINGAELSGSGEMVVAAPSMFHEDSQMSFSGESWHGPSIVSRRVKAGSNFITDRGLVKITEKLGKVRQELPVPNGGGESALVAELAERYPAIRKLQNELRVLLAPILGEDRIRSLSSPHDVYGNYLAVRTLMSWAAGILYAHQTGKNFIAYEVPVLHGVKVRRLSGGRLDLLEVLAVNEKQPSQSHLKILAEIVRRRGRGSESVGPLVATLMGLLGARLDFSVCDLKFEHGDGGGSKPLDYAEIVVAPQGKDQVQMRRYLTAADLDLHLHRRVSRGKRSGEPVWSDDSNFRFGTITHFFADSKPVDHLLEMNAAARLNFFQEDIVPRLAEARSRAIVREVDNFVSTLAEQPSQVRKAPRVFTIPMALPVDNDNPYEQALQEVIDENRIFVDDNGLVELRYGKSGKPYKVFHLKRAIDIGWIKRGTDLTRDVNIPCPLPGHPRRDKRPSARLYHDRHVYCFVHGEGMLITEEELPDKLIGAFQPWSGERRERVVEKWHIPPEHTAFMNKVQEILQTVYRQDKRGRKYLGEERCLDPDLAFHYGAGFASKALVSGLLESGFTLEDLAHFGVVEYSSKVYYQESLGPFLEKLGLRREHIVRTVKGENPNKPLRFSPTFPLEDRVTFPLEGQDEGTGAWSITNFYGRSIDPRKRAHNKLFVAHTGVAAGGFNVRRALDSKYDVLFVTEAAIDALTAIEFGYEPITAIIGLQNPILIRLLVREAENKGLDMAAVFDDEGEGHKRTMGFVDEVRRNGFTNRVVPFMDQFMRAHPQIGCKDFNALKVR